MGKSRSVFSAACLFWSQRNEQGTHGLYQYCFFHSEFDSITFRFAFISTIDSTQQGTFESQKAKTIQDHIRFSKSSSDIVVNKSIRVRNQINRLFTIKID
eukprot:scaffold343173_cov55-Attheya_sp.AAC.4